MKVLTPAVSQILTDPAASDWLKSVLVSSLARDPIDALNDVSVLLAALEAQVQIEFAASVPPAPDGTARRESVAAIRIDAKAARILAGAAPVEDGISGCDVTAASADRAIVTAGVAALQRLLGRVDRHWHTGQSRSIVAFLAGLYNGADYPFDLTELRGVDRDIAEDCLSLLRLDTLGLKEVHRYIERGAERWATMIEEYGLKPLVRR